MGHVVVDECDQINVYERAKNYWTEKRHGCYNVARIMSDSVELKSQDISYFSWTWVD